MLGKSEFCCSFTVDRNLLNGEKSLHKRKFSMHSSHNMILTAMYEPGHFSELFSTSKALSRGIVLLICESKSNIQRALEDLH